MKKQQWTYKVVKRQRGANGKAFWYPAAATFSSEHEARKYAVSFAEEQYGTVGTGIDVQTRGGHTVCQIDTRTGKVTDF